MLVWQPDKAEAYIVTPRGKHGPGSILPGVVADYPESVRRWLKPVEAATPAPPAPPAPAPVPERSDIDEPAEAPQAVPELDGLHWRRVASLSDGLGYDGDDRTKAARLAWLHEQPPAAVADALAALED
jgi:hypothetical protein